MEGKCSQVVAGGFGHDRLSLISQHIVGFMFEFVVVQIALGVVAVSVVQHVI